MKAILPLLDIELIHTILIAVFLLVPFNNCQEGSSSFQYFIDYWWFIPPDKL